MYVSPRRLYLDRDGKVVEADDPARVQLLVKAGGTLPEDEAQRYGLIEAPEEKAITKPKANKAIGKAPSNKKV